MMRFLQAFLRAAATVVIVAAVAIRPAPAQTIDANLIEAAKKEGEVVWYTTLVVTQIVRPLVQAFEKKYPGAYLLAFRVIISIFELVAIGGAA